MQDEPGRQRSTVSVALCTYNGERFLPQQLRSILAQSRPPDEVVVCDDGSVDQTPALLADFAANASFPVRIVRNARTLGSTANFLQAIRLCTGRLIALCDQDDVWLPNRLARSEQVLLGHPEAVLLFSDAALIDDQGRPLDVPLWSRCGFSSTLQGRLADGDYGLCVQHRFVTGATVMFRTELRDRCFPAGEGWIHDEWLAAAAALFGGLHALPEPLILYRRHPSQQVGPARRLSRLQRCLGAFVMLVDADRATAEHWQGIAEAAGKTQTVCARFTGADLAEPGAARLASYQRYADFLTARLRLSSHRTARLLPVLRRRAAYAQYAGVGSVLKDLLLCRPAAGRERLPGAQPAYRSAPANPGHPFAGQLAGAGGDAQGQRPSGSSGGALA